MKEVQGSMFWMLNGIQEPFYKIVVGMVMESRIFYLVFK